MRKVPELRFDGFSGEWEEKEFGKVIERKSKSSANNSLPRVEYEDIIPEIGKLNKDINSKSSIKKGIYFESGDVLFGKLRPYLKNYLNPQFEGIAVGDFWILNNKSGDNSFLFYYIQIPKFQYIANTSIGTKMPRSDWNLVSGSNFIYPSNNEQEKIGNLFKKLDALIEIQEGKVSKMEDFKKSMLQKTFPKKGELVPEFRFEGFDGEWKSSKLKHIGIVKSGVGFPEKFQGGISGIPFFKVSDMNLGSNNIIMKNAQNYVSASDIITNKWNVITDKPAIIFAKVGAAIFLERKRIVTKDFLIDNNMMAFIPKVKSDLYFYKVFLDTTRLTKYAQSGALPSYNANDIYRIPIKLPSVEEQQKIGQFFKNLDSQIENEEKLLDSYKMMKKSLLQKMFV